MTMTITAQTVKIAYFDRDVASSLVCVLEAALEDAKTDLLRKEKYAVKIGNIYDANMHTMKEYRACKKIQS